MELSAADGDLEDGAGTGCGVHLHSETAGGHTAERAGTGELAARSGPAAGRAEHRHRLGIDLRHGVYAAVQGPAYETPAEIRYLRTIGADAVGMSTVPEAIAARHMSMDVLGISCITNMAAGMLPRPLDHGDILEAVEQLHSRFTALVEGILARL